MIPSYSLSLLNVIPFKIFFFFVYRFLSSFQSSSGRRFHVSRVINSLSNMQTNSQTDSTETFSNKTVSYKIEFDSSVVKSLLMNFSSSSSFFSWILSLLKIELSVSFDSFASSSSFDSKSSEMWDEMNSISRSKSGRKIFKVCLRNLLVALY